MVPAEAAFVHLQISLVTKSRGKYRRSQWMTEVILTMNVLVDTLYTFLCFMREIRCDVKELLKNSVFVL